VDGRPLDLTEMIEGLQSIADNEEIEAMVYAGVDILGQVTFIELLKQFNINPKTVFFVPMTTLEWRDYPANVSNFVTG